MVKVPAASAEETRPETVTVVEKREKERRDANEIDIDGNNRETGIRPSCNVYGLGPG